MRKAIPVGEPAGSHLGTRERLVEQAGLTSADERALRAQIEKLANEDLDDDQQIAAWTKIKGIVPGLKNYAGASSPKSQRRSSYELPASNRRPATSSAASRCMPAVTCE